MNRSWVCVHVHMCVYCMATRTIDTTTTRIVVTTNVTTAIRVRNAMRRLFEKRVDDRGRCWSDIVGATNKAVARHKVQSQHKGVVSWRLVDIPFVPPMFFPPFGWIGCCLICVPLPSNKGTTPSPNVFTGAFCLRDNVFWTVWDHHHSTFNSICHPTVVHENRAIFVGASFSIDTQCTHTHTHATGRTFVG